MVSCLLQRITILLNYLQRSRLLKIFKNDIAHYKWNVMKTLAFFAEIFSYVIQHRYLALRFLFPSLIFVSNRLSPLFFPFIHSTFPLFLWANYQKASNHCLARSSYVIILRHCTRTPRNRLMPLCILTWLNSLVVPHLNRVLPWLNEVRRLLDNIIRNRGKYSASTTTWRLFVWAKREYQLQPFLSASGVKNIYFKQAKGILPALR